MKGALLSLVLAATLGGLSPAVRVIDTTRSKAQFSVRHIWVEHVTGTVPILRGSVTLAPNSLIPIAASAVLDATQIATGEPDRDRSLESPDFFDAQKFPQWTFTSTTIVARGSNAFEMDGNLTIHGVTRSERLHVAVSGTPESPMYHATGQIDRHAFGMATTRLDPTIGSVADITLDAALR